MSLLSTVKNSIGSAVNKAKTDPASVLFPNGIIPGTSSGIIPTSSSSLPSVPSLNGAQITAMVNAAKDKAAGASTPSAAPTSIPSISVPNILSQTGKSRENPISSISSISSAIPSTSGGGGSLQSILGGLLGGGSGGSGISNILSGLLGNSGGGTSSIMGQVLGSGSPIGKILSPITSIGDPGKTLQQDMPGIANDAVNVMNQESKNAVAAGFDANGMPVYNQITNPDGTLKAPYNVSSSLDSSGLDSLKNYAEGKSQSPWLSAALNANNAATNNLVDQAAKSSAQQKTGAMADIASHGGLRSGAMERLGASGGDQTALARQSALNQGNMNQLGLYQQEGQNMFNAMQALPGQQLAAANYTTGINQNNVANAINDQLNQLQNKQFIYGQNMQEKGAEATANAISNSGKK